MVYVKLQRTISLTNDLQRVLAKYNKTGQCVPNTVEVILALINEYESKFLPFNFALAAVSPYILSQYEPVKVAITCALEQWMGQHLANTTSPIRRGDTTLPTAIPASTYLKAPHSSHTSYHPLVITHTQHIAQTCAHLSRGQNELRPTPACLLHHSRHAGP